MKRGGGGGVKKQATVRIWFRIVAIYLQAVYTVHEQPRWGNMKKNLTKNYETRITYTCTVIQECALTLHLPVLNQQPLGVS
jgi:hypothetical protein